MIRNVVTVQLETGIHARPAAQLVALIRNFKSEIKLIHGSIEANAKSMINLLTLNATQGTELTVQCDGPDETEAMDTVTHFLKGVD